MDTKILFRVLLYIGTVLAFVFGFLGYVVIRPSLLQMMSEYSLGLIEGGLIVFILTALPLTYGYLRAKESKS